MRIFVLLHVLTMFTGVALGYGAMAWLWLASRSGDLAAMRGVLSVFGRYERIVPATFSLGIVLGLVAVFTSGFDPLQPWLVIAYLLATGLVLSGSLSISPWVKRVAAVAATTPGEHLDAPLAPFRDRRSVSLLLLDLAMLLAIITDMIIKPFS